MENYKLVFLKVSKEYADKLCDRLPQCPRVFFLSRIKEDIVVIGIYAEDYRTMECRIESFKKSVGTENLYSYEIEDFVTPYWEFEVLDREREQTFCRIINCCDCSSRTQCMGCPGTVWYQQLEKIKN